MLVARTQLTMAIVLYLAVAFRAADAWLHHVDYDFCPLYTSCVELTYLWPDL